MNGGSTAIHTQNNFLFKGDSRKAFDLEKAITAPFFEQENYTLGLTQYCESVKERPLKKCPTFSKKL
jgi:hypothetical protein